MIEGLLFSTEVNLVEARKEEMEQKGISRKQQHELQKLLKKYEAIFKEPKGLPPMRGREHAINLTEGQGPINVRPYRYPHHHKMEIEKQVRFPVLLFW